LDKFISDRKKEVISTVFKHKNPKILKTSNIILLIMSEKPEIKKFYGDLAGDTYLREIRRFGLRYDEMVDTLVGLLSLTSPTDILDIGCGVGNIDEAVFQTVPGCNITCVELSPEMVDVARKRLGQYGEDKLKIVCSDILEYEPDKKYDAIFSNLAIHNLPLEDKKIVLRKVRDWLKPEGVFIWGDFMDWGDTEVSKYFMEYRRQKVLESGASEQFVDEVFKKEAQDYRLTVVETVDLLREAEFEPEVLWAYSFLSIFRAKK